MDALRAAYEGKRVLITGNTGFKGSWLTVWLLELGAEVHGYSCDVPTDPAMFEVLGLAERIAHVEGDVSDLPALQTAMDAARPDYVFHLAAQPIVSLSYSDPIRTVASNVMGTVNMMQALRRVEHPCRAVLITSDKCYENVEWEWGYREDDRLGGKDVYSGSKAAAEAMISCFSRSFFAGPERHVALASARAGNVIGGGDWARDRIVVDCVTRWAEGQPVTVRSPGATRPWQHVLEPLSGYLTLGQQLQVGSRLDHSAFNFGPRAEQNATVETLIRRLFERWTATELDDPFDFHTVGSFAEAGLLKLNCDRALSRLAWQPTLDLETCLDFTGSWYSQYYAGETDMYAATLQQIRAYGAAAQARGLDWAA